MKLYLHIVAFAMCVMIAFIMIGFIYEAMPLFHGMIAISICLVALWGSVECLKELE